MLDTEWHCIFDCPVNLAPRRHFRLALQINKVNSRKVKFQSADVRQRIAIASDLAVLVANCRSDEQLVNVSRFTTLDERSRHIVHAPARRCDSGIEPRSELRIH